MFIKLNRMDGSEFMIKPSQLVRLTPYTGKKGSYIDLGGDIPLETVSQSMEEINTICKDFTAESQQRSQVSTRKR